ncbi:MAG: histidine kinase, partial [Haloarculaceae archaeon]
MHQSLDPDEARHELYRTMRSDADLVEKAERALEIGVEYLEVDKGHVTRIDPASDYWEAIASTEPESGQFPVGRVLDLKRTYCRKTVE